MCLSLLFAVHLGNVNQKKNVKQLTKQLNDKKSHVLSGNSGTVKAVDNFSATKNATSDISQPSTRQLQLEIQELQRMQKQLKSEMVSAGDNAQKTKLLQHIETQIQLRRMQQTRDKKQHQNNLSQQLNVGLSSQVNLHQQQSLTAKDLNVVVPPKTKTQTNLQTQTELSEHQKQIIQTSQYQQQHDQIQQLKQKKQELQKRSHYSVQSKRKSIAPGQTSLQQTYVNNPGIGQNAQMQYANADVMYNNLDLQNLQSQQQQAQMPAISPTAFVQQRVPVQLSNQVGMNQPQINFVDQQVMGMKQGGVPLDSSQQHVLVPLNALAVNNLVPSNMLSSDRFIVLDTALQDNLQLSMADGPLVIQSEKKKSTEKPTTTSKPTTKASTQVQQITKPTTQRPSTTVTTNPPTTHTPTPPTTERYFSLYNLFM